jgi:DNA-directed RNA polymerase subunit RPC12/RpoP
VFEAAGKNARWVRECRESIDPEEESMFRRLLGARVACARCDSIFTTRGANRDIECPRCGGRAGDVDFLTSDDRVMCPACYAEGQEPTKLLTNGCTACGARPEHVRNV